MRNLSDYIKNGVVRMKNGDGGDGAMKTAFLHVFQIPPPDSSLLVQSIKSLFPSPGVLIRCPDDGIAWHKDPRCTSRDQIVGWFCVFALIGFQGFLWNLSLAHIKRFGFCQNWRDEQGKWKVADYLTPDIWGVAIRGLRLWPLWLVIFLTDFFVLFNSIILCFIKDPDNVGDDQNHLAMLRTCHRIYPTPISEIAEWVYMRFRFQNYGCFMPDTEFNDDQAIFQAYTLAKNGSTIPRPFPPVEGSVVWYHRDAVGAPPLAQIALPIIKQEFL